MKNNIIGSVQNFAALARWAKTPEVEIHSRKAKAQCKECREDVKDKVQLSSTWRNGTKKWKST